MFQKRQLKRKINIKFLLKKQTGKDTVCRSNTECFISMMKCYSMINKMLQRHFEHRATPKSIMMN